MKKKRYNVTPISGIPRKVRRDKRMKRYDSAKLAKPKVKYVSHAAGSNLLEDPLDNRTRVGKMYRAQRALLTTHIGEHPTLPQEKLIDQAVRLAMLTDIAWAELMRSKKLVTNGAVHPAFEAFLKASRDQRAVLIILGLKRQTKNIPDLQDYLRQKTIENDAQPQLTEDGTSEN